MTKEEEKIIDYIVVCTNEFADRLNISYKDAFNYLKKYNVIKFIKDNYEIEHTLSIDDTIDDMILVARNNGGNMYELSKSQLIHG